ncbi:hypothetical protein NM688_g6305 [Phlebia brevispora]|uniref:Uncharacterized protein n=1 Tax=Phlebia brevispora TaxID=194682 RepID=A0ACC1SHS0_9APHY|nr:hypothetical protein NM688_g6305 [Phlebia brevispora]
MRSSLWPRSTAYNAHTLEQATQHVDTMTANHGGTEIRAALEYMFTSRSQDRPTSRFVLTDGEAYDVDETIASVTRAVAAARADAPLRVFTLGIGESASTAMCSGIARAGKGICLMTANTEAIIAKASKLVKASRTEILEDVSVDWGESSVPLDSTQMQVDFQFHQGPKILPLLYAGNRFIVFAIIKDMKYRIPEEVSIRARRSQTGEILKSTVPVETLEPSSESPQGILIHTLAARRIIMDLEDRQQGDIAHVKGTIVHLGEQYQLANRFTSFIAVENENQKKLNPIPWASADESVLDSSARGLTNNFFAMGWSPRGRSALVHPAAAPSLSVPPAPNAILFGQSSTPSMGMSEPRGGATMSLFGAAPPAMPPLQLSPSSYRVGSFGAPASMSQSPHSPVPGPDNMLGGTAQPRDDVEQLVRLQAFDGSFPLSNELKRILGRSALARAREMQVDDKVWATILAVAYLQKHLDDQPELLEGLLEKAMMFVEQSPVGDVDALIQIAKGLVP